MTAPPGRRSAAMWLVALAIGLFTLNLRTAVASISPIAGLIGVDLRLDATALGLLGAAPPFVFAVAGLATPALARRIGLEAAAVLTLVVIVVGHLLRTFAPTTPVLLVGHVVALLAMGTGSVLGPALIKRIAPTALGTMTTVFGTVFSISSALPPFVAVPVAEAFGWRASLAVWAVLAFAAIPPLLVVIRAARGVEDEPEIADPLEAEHRLRRPIWHSPTVIGISIVFCLASVGGFTVFAWLPSVLIELGGFDPATAGLLVGVFGLVSVPAGFVAPRLAAMPRLVPVLIVLLSAMFGLGFLGVALLPAVAPAWLLLASLGTVQFPLCFALLALRTREHLTTVAASGFVQAIPYLLAALWVFGVGPLHAAVGEWRTPLIATAVAVAASAGSALLLRHDRFIDDELARS